MGKVRKFRATPAGVENRPEGGRTGEEPGAQGPKLNLKCPCDRKERIDMNIDGDGTSAGAELAGVHRAELAGASLSAVRLTSSSARRNEGRQQLG